MRRAAAGSVLFFFVAPFVMAGVIPWLLTDWEAAAMPVLVRALGWLLIAAGVTVLVHAFARCVIEGLGTPAPVAETERLVVGGAYRYVRNPMYVAVIATIVGQALLLGRPVLLAYAGLFASTVYSFVHLYEEPRLRERFGTQYEAYRR